MKVTIIVEPGDSDDDHFTSNQLIQGKVMLDLPKADTVSKIKISLQGNIYSRAAVGNTIDTLDDDSFDHKLFEFEEVLLPHHDVTPPTKGFTLPKGSMNLPFHFTFPVMASCQSQEGAGRHPDSTLPPSFKFQSPGRTVIAEVMYYLLVNVLRPSSFKSDVSVKKEIQFMPLNASLPPPMIDPTRRRTTSLLTFQPPKTSGRRSSTSNIPQPIATATVTLEVTLPSPSILQIGSRIPANISIDISENGNSNSPQLFLETFQMIIEAGTTITFKDTQSRWRTPHKLVSIWKIPHKLVSSSALHIPIGPQQDFQNFLDGLWGNFKLPDILDPSFTTCFVVHQHSLVVIIGVSNGTGNSIEEVRTVVNVELHSRVPVDSQFGQEDVFTSDVGRETPFIPWRVGSQRHLGIQGRPGGEADTSLPPPYSDG